MTQDLSPTAHLDSGVVRQKTLSALTIGVAVFGLFAIVTGCADVVLGPHLLVANGAALGASVNDPRLDSQLRFLGAMWAGWGVILVWTCRDLGTRMLRESLAETIVFSNPTQTRHGLADMARHLERFQVRVPGGSFRMNNMVGWGTYTMAEWQLVDAKAEPGFSGYDVLAFDQQGRISNILLFGSVEQLKLAWRRRDPVSLQLTEVDSPP